MFVKQLYTSCLAEAAYYVESAGKAAIIDPLREADEYLALAAARNAEIVYIFETHFHADFISGHLELARKTGAQIVYGPGAETHYPVRLATDAEEFSLGECTIRVLHTPGHTPESVCYLLLDSKENPYAVFTGDTLFVGDVGRPDLLDGVLSKETLAGMLYDSLNNVLKPLPDEVIVYPAHGPGSACGKNIGRETESSIGIQKKENYAMLAADKSEFIRQVTENMSPPPSYFFDDARINKMGYRPIEEIIKNGYCALKEDQFHLLMKEGVTLLDTRSPQEFEAGYIPGSVNIGLMGQFAVWAATLFPLSTRFILITDEGKEKESITRLARVGFEGVEGYLENGMSGYTGSLKKITSIEPEEFYEIDTSAGMIVDVRKPGEYASGHLYHAQLFTLAGLEEHFPNPLSTQPLYLYCAGGHRSMIAASLLSKKGLDPIVNIRGGFEKIVAAGAGVKEVHSTG